MKNLITIGLLVILFSGCKTYVQVFETKGNVETEDGFHVFENDSLKIEYSFWKEDGLMAFTIFNKLNKPIYLDWKKSSYIDNSVKLDYWVDEEKEKTLAYYGSYYYDASSLVPGLAISNTKKESTSSTVKVERITFIPPKSIFYKSQFHILPGIFFKLNAETTYSEVPRNDKPKKKTKVYEMSYSKDQSIHIFRNFLTFSISEDFEEEFYVDNEFYISNLKEMDSRHFEYAKRDKDVKLEAFNMTYEKRKIIKFFEDKKESSFYIHIPYRTAKH